MITHDKGTSINSYDGTLSIQKGSDTISYHNSVLVHHFRNVSVIP